VSQKIVGCIWLRFAVTSLEVVDNDSKLQQLYYGLLNAYIGPKTAKLLFSCK